MSSLKGKSYKEIYGEKFQDKISLRKYSKQEIKEMFIPIWNKYGPFSKWQVCCLYQKYKMCCGEVIKKEFGSMDNFAKEMKIQYVIPDKMKNIRLNKEKMLVELEKVFNDNPNMLKTDLKILYKQKKLSFGIDVIRHNFGSLDKLAKILNYKFKERDLNDFGNNIGKNEKQILDIIERQKQIKLHRQKKIIGYYVDGYDSINNIVYEVDEQYHILRKEYDKVREERIKQFLGCTFIRINEQEFLKNMGWLSLQY